MFVLPTFPTFKVVILLIADWIYWNLWRNRPATGLGAASCDVINFLIPVLAHLHASAHVQAGAVANVSRLFEACSLSIPVQVRGGCISDIGLSPKSVDQRSTDGASQLANNWTTPPDVRGDPMLNRTSYTKDTMMNTVVLGQART